MLVIILVAQVNLFIVLPDLNFGIISQNANKQYSNYLDINLFSFSINKMDIRVMCMEHKTKLTS